MSTQNKQMIRKAYIVKEQGPQQYGYQRSYKKIRESRVVHVTTKTRPLNKISQRSNILSRELNLDASVKTKDKSQGPVQGNTINSEARRVYAGRRTQGTRRNYGNFGGMVSRQNYSAGRNSGNTY